jgi:signal peptidase I
MTSLTSANELPAPALDAAPANPVAEVPADASAAPLEPAAAPVRRSFASRMWSNWIKPIGMAVLVVTTFRSAVADWNDVPSQSMEPTILVGDRIFVNKLAYDLKVPFTKWRLAEWSDPQRGDIVVFFSPADGKRMVKRVVGVPGDEIALVQNRLHINGQPVQYESADGAAIDAADLTDPAPYLFQMESLGAEHHPVMVQPARPARRSFRTLKVPEGQYFLMGDNRDNSGDSRIFGFVPREQIMGKAVGLAFSLDTQSGYAPRWKRFFRGLE